VSLWRDPDDVPHCRILSPWQNWMVDYLVYTLRMKMLFRGWPVMVHDTHTRRRLRSAVRIFTSYYRETMQHSLFRNFITYIYSVFEKKLLPYVFRDKIAIVCLMVAIWGWLHNPNSVNAMYWKKYAARLPDSVLTNFLRMFNFICLEKMKKL